jgi:hypothetical protein
MGPQDKYPSCFKSPCRAMIHMTTLGYQEQLEKYLIPFVNAGEFVTIIINRPMQN